jgi:DNA mismatch repair protein MutS
MSETVLRTPGGATRAAAARSPLMEQYAQVKHDHGDAFLFFRLGAFYEMFFEDAIEGARLLGLTLPSRNKQDPDPIPMCGLPWHQREAYVGRLLRMGRKVAICDQLEEATESKGLVQRGVTEVFTPGSVVGESFLEPATNNFLAALWPRTEGLGLCLVDASTSEVRLAEAAWDETPELLGSLTVAEWIAPQLARLPEELQTKCEAALEGRAGSRSFVPPDGFLNETLLATRWGAAAAPLEALPLAAAAAAGALTYLDRVQGADALLAPVLRLLSEERVLRYDAATARHLEIFQAQPGGEGAHTLWHHVNLAVTGPGARRLRAWLERPLADLAALERRQQAVQHWLAGGVERGSFRETLRGFPDLERLASRLALGRATPRDLGALRDALHRLP